MIFKTTIQRSNPQIIREFEIEETRTIRDMLMTIRIVHNWNDETVVSIFRDGVLMSENDKIADLFREEMGEEQWLIKVPLPQKYHAYSEKYGDDQEYYALRLEVVDAASVADPENTPRLLRYRGYNPELSAVSVGNWNAMSHELVLSGRYYDYYSGSLHLDRFEVDCEEMNRELHLKVQLGVRVFAVNRDRQQPLRSLLNQFTVADIQTMIMDEELNIKTGGKKDQIIGDVVKTFSCERFWYHVLEQMTWKGYTIFKQAVVSGNYSELSEVSVLVQYRLVVFNMGRVQWIAKELLDFYEGWMTTQGDEKLLAKKQAETIYMCASSLYAVFNLKLITRLGKVMFPQNFDQTAVLEQWKEGLDYALVVNPNNKSGQEEFMYHKGDYRPEAVGHVLKMMSRVEMDYYIPNREEAFQIAEEGLCFSNRTKLKIASLLEKMRRPGYILQTKKIVYDIYRMRQLNYSDSSIHYYLKKAQPIQATKKESEKFLLEIRPYFAEVRQVLLYGHTPAEAKERYHVELSGGSE